MSIISPDSVILRQAKNIAGLNLDALQAKVLKDNSDTMVDINRSQMEGSRMKGGLMPEYSQTSLFLKDFSDYNGIYPHFNLKDTGSFQDKMFGMVKGNEFIISSKDSKTPDLVDRLSENIFELDEQSMKQAQMVNTIDYNKEVHKAINK